MDKNCSESDINGMLKEVNKLEKKKLDLKEKELINPLNPEEKDDLDYYTDRINKVHKEIVDCGGQVGSERSRMSVTEIENGNGNNRNRLVAVLLIGLVLFAGLFGIMMLRPASDLTGEGYAVNVNVGVNLLNGDLNDTVAIPRSSALVEEVPIYYDSFENTGNIGNWNTYLSVTWGKNNPKAYNGTYAIRWLPNAVSDYGYFNNTRNFTLDYNETVDISYYVYKLDPQISVINDFFRFSVMVNWTDVNNVSQSLKITNLMDSLGYNASTREVVLNNTFYQYLWNGFLLRDIRNITYNYDTSIYERPFTISNMSFEIKSSQLVRIDLDDFKIVKNPYRFTNVWYYKNTSAIGYQVTVDYTVLVNTVSFVDTRDIIVAFEIYNSIITNLGNIPPFLIENIRLANMTFTLNADPFYDGIFTGNYTGKIIYFPEWNAYGDSMNYSFYTRIEGFGLLKSNEYTNDVVIKDLPSQAFGILWKKPLRVY